MVTEEGEELDRHLFQGEMWGVLRGLDVGLDLEHVLQQVPVSQHKMFSLVATCETCNKGFIKVFQEEAEYLETRLPFVCQYGVGSVVRGDPDNKTVGE